MNFRKSLTQIGIVGCIFLLTGCEFRHYTDIVPVSGYLQTPEGKFKFKKLTDKQFDSYFPNQSARRQKEAILLAESENTKLFYCAMYCSPEVNFMIAQPKKRAKGTVFSDEFKYQRGKQILGNPRVKFDLSAKDMQFQLRSPFISQGVADYYYSAFMINGPIGSTTAEVLENTHSLKIPFEIEGVSYLADFSFKIKSGRRLSLNIGAPATP